MDEFEMLVLAMETRFALTLHTADAPLEVLERIACRYWSLR